MKYIILGIICILFGFVSLWVGTYLFMVIAKDMEWIEFPAFMTTFLFTLGSFAGGGALIAFSKELTNK